MRREVAIVAPWGLEFTVVGDNEYIVSTIEVPDQMRELADLALTVGEVPNRGAWELQNFHSLVMPYGEDDQFDPTENELEYAHYETLEEALAGHEALVEKWENATSDN